MSNLIPITISSMSRTSKNPPPIKYDFLELTRLPTHHRII